MKHHIDSAMKKAIIASNGGGRYPAVQKIGADTEKDLKKGDYTTVEVRADPNDMNSPKMKITVRLLKDLEAETVLEWYKTMTQSVIPNLGIQQPRAKALFLEDTMRGTPRSTWRRIYTPHLVGPNQILSVQNFNASLQAFLTEMLPPFALKKQRCHMLWGACKSIQTDVRTWFADVKQANNDLALFPPNFNAAQRFPEDITMAIAENGLPSSYTKKAVLQGHDSTVATEAETIEFYTRLQDVDTDRETESAAKCQLRFDAPTRPGKRTQHRSNDNHSSKKRATGGRYDRKPTARRQYTPEEKKAYWESKKKKERESMITEVVAAVMAAQELNDKKRKSDDSDADDDSVATPPNEAETEAFATSKFSQMSISDDEDKKRAAMPNLADMTDSQIDELLNGDEVLETGKAKKADAKDDDSSEDTA